MTDPRMEREQRVMQAYDRLLDVPAAERIEFVREHFADDAALARDLERLLEAGDRADSGLLGEPVDALARPMLADLSDPHVVEGVDLRVRLGSALASRYRVEKQIGSGGMATVYLAFDSTLGRPVAIKALRPELADRLTLERFEREVAIAARLDHPRIVPVYDRGAAAGVLYYVMRHVGGGSLRDRLGKRRRFEMPQALHLARQIAGALDYAHARHVVHRDIKPENILLDANGVYVADFGVARLLDAAGREHLTQTGLAIGTALYMSPEQAESSADVDGRSDVYSLTCVIYEMLAGEPPYTGPTQRDVLIKHMVAPIPDLCAVRPDVTAGVQEVIAAGLHKSAAERVATARELVDRLMRAHLARAEGLVADRGPAAPPRTIAVLPFENMSGDPGNDYFSDGITEELIGALTRAGGVRVVARTSCFAFKTQHRDIREIGAALGATHVLEGSVRMVGRRLRASAQLVDARSGNPLWSERYDRDVEDVFAVQDDITSAIVVRLRRDIERPVPVGEERVPSSPLPGAARITADVGTVAAPEGDEPTEEAVARLAGAEILAPPAPSHMDSGNQLPDLRSSGLPGGLASGEAWGVGGDMPRGPFASRSTGPWRRALLVGLPLVIAAAAAVAMFVNREMGSVSVAPGGVATPAPGTVTFAGIPSRVTVGDTFTLAAAVIDSVGARVPASATNWRSSNPEIASVDSATGRVTGKGPGEVTIDADVAGTPASARLYVDVPPAGPIARPGPDSSPVPTQEPSTRAPVRGRGIVDAWIVLLVLLVIVAFPVGRWWMARRRSAARTTVEVDEALPGEFKAALPGAALPPEGALPSPPRAAPPALMTRPLPRPRPPVQQFAAFDAYLRGRSLLRFESRADALEDAIQQFENALGVYPMYDAAYAARAYARTLLARTGVAASPDLRRAAMHDAETALGLAPTLPEAHVANALVAMFFEWDRETALAALERAVEISPAHADAHLWRGFALMWLAGKPEDAVRSLEQAMKFDPLSLVARVQMAVAHWMKGDLERARRQADNAVESGKLLGAYAPGPDRSLERPPADGLASAHHVRAVVLAELGRLDEALADATDACRVGGRQTMHVAHLGMIHGLRGDAASARAVIDELEARARQGATVSTGLATVYRGLREWENVLACLDEAYDARDVNLVFVPFSRHFAELRSNPRFGELLAKLRIG